MPHRRILPRLQRHCYMGQRLPHLLSQMLMPLPQRLQPRDWHLHCRLHRPKLRRPLLQRRWLRTLPPRHKEMRLRLQHRRHRTQLRTPRWRPILPGRTLQLPRHPNQILRLYMPTGIFRRYLHAMRLQPRGLPLLPLCRNRRLQRHCHQVCLQRILRMVWRDRQHHPPCRVLCDCRHLIVLPRGGPEDLHLI